MGKSGEIDLSREVGDILGDYVDTVVEETNKTFSNMGNKTRNKLKKVSPKDTGAYAAGWSKKTVKSTNYRRPEPDTVIVRNKTRWMMTHLLENGYIHYKTGQRVGKRKHIEPVEKEAIEETVKELKRRLGQI